MSSSGFDVGVAQHDVSTTPSSGSDVRFTANHMSLPISASNPLEIDDDEKLLSRYRSRLSEKLPKPSSSKVMMPNLGTYSDASKRCSFVRLQWTGTTRTELRVATAEEV